MNKINHQILQIVDLIKEHHINQRSIFAIAGAPASGKSTIAEELVNYLNIDNKEDFPKASLVPMDGFHLNNNILIKCNQLHEKGAPHTFDALGFYCAIEQLATKKADYYLPKFSREQDKTITNSIFVSAKTPIIIVEGNYLLLKNQPWLQLKDYFDATIMIKTNNSVLYQRLIKRWLDNGLSQEEAEQKAQLNDMKNALIVENNSYTADLYIKS